LSKKQSEKEAVFIVPALGDFSKYISEPFLTKDVSKTSMPHYIKGLLVV
jgi:hypothetical protein